MAGTGNGQRGERWVSLLVFASALAVGAAGARDFAGGWNDGSRLATIESLVDRGTLAIDASIFVRPSASRPGVKGPYAPADELCSDGTHDKLLIGGRYYSDKSPAPSVLLAGLYKALQVATGLTARARPDAFSYWMTFLSSGLAYAVAVWSTFRVSRLVGLTMLRSGAVAAGLALATVAPAYCRHINGHILLLGVAAPLTLALVQLGQRADDEPRPAWLVPLIGALAGLGYGCDLGVGPMLVLAALGLVASRAGTHSAFIAALTAAPWVALHHALNYAVGGTWKPANAVLDYLRWPGSPFDAGNATGTWHHGGVGHFLVYAAALLFGKRGFILHNLPLALPLVGVATLARCRRERPELLFALAWAACSWLAYAATSTNYSGPCCSIRWFVPLLAPGFYALAVFLKRRPDYWPDYTVLGAGGAVLAALMWHTGPWAAHMVPHYWPIVAATLVGWLTCRWLKSRRPSPTTATVAPARKVA